jgi:hypothetical protein
MLRGTREAAQGATSTGGFDAAATQQGLAGPSYEPSMPATVSPQAGAPNAYPPVSPAVSDAPVVPTGSGRPVGGP